MVPGKATACGSTRVALQSGTAGTFSDSGQSLGNFDSRHDVSLGDVDGDGDLDAFVANRDQYKATPTACGSTRVARRAARPARSATAARAWGISEPGVSLGDVDGDGDLDAFVANA